MCTNFKLDMSKINHWLLTWFNLFLSIDRLDLVRYMPCFFKELICKTGQINSDITNQSLEKFLKDLRHELGKKPYIKSRRFCITILKILNESCDPKSNKKKLLEVFNWMHDILAIQLSPEVANAKDDDIYVGDMDGSGFGESNTNFEDIISDILLFTLQCLSNEDEQIRTSALKVNTLLQERILDVVKIEKKAENSATFSKIFETLQRMISVENYTTVYYAMRWIEHLIDNFPTELTELSEKIIRNLESDNLKIVETSVVLIAKIVNKLDKCDMISNIVRYLESMMKQDYDQSKSLSILKTLFCHVDGNKLLSYFSKSLKITQDRDFKINMVQNLDLVLNIEEKVVGLRANLKDPKNGLFDILFDIWCSDPISCISLSLLGERYELSEKIVSLTSLANLNVNMMVRLAQIVKLIDMPHYASLRMQLLRPKK